MVIGDIRLLEKTGGKEDYVRDEAASTPVPPTSAASSVPTVPPAPTGTVETGA